MKKTILPVVALLSVLSVVSGCSNASKSKSVDFSSMTLEQIEAKAKEEGHLETVGMPDDWANWGESWAGYTAKYGITHNDTDMASSEELAAFDSEKDSPTRDMGDVGQGHGQIAIDMDVVQGYKPTTWDTIPDWAKDPDGRWIVSYLGTYAFLTNVTSVGEEVTSFAQLKDMTCKVNVGDVVRGTSSQLGVIAAAYAYGGDLDNLQPGIDYFKELAQAGRIDVGNLNSQRFSMGEIDVALQWDYNLLTWRDIAKQDNPSLECVAHVASDGALQSGYCLVFNKYAPHPHAAALAIEYLLSDEGQIHRAKGYATPIRDVELPAEVEAMRIPSSEYGNAIPLTDNIKLTEACETVARMWEDEIIPLLS